MVKGRYFPDTIEEQLEWLGKFSKNLGAYAVKYGISTAQVNAIKADFEYLNYWYKAQRNAEAYFHAATAFRTELANGSSAQPGTFTEPVLPALGAAPAAVEPGIFARALAFAAIIRNSLTYSVTDGEAMALEGAHEHFDPEAGKPVIKAKLVDTGHPHLKIKKGNYQGWILYKDDGSGSGFVKVDKLLRAAYIDRDPLPASGHSATWRYKAVYIYKDKIAGAESNPISVVVFGGAS